MLVKSVCSNCEHSFLTDDQAGDLTCPRCGFVSDGVAPPEGPAFSELSGGAMALPADQDVYIPAPQPSSAPHIPQTFDPVGAFEGPAHFDPRALPPTFMTWDRMLRGMLLGGIAMLALGAAIGCGLAATGLIVPGVAAIIMAFAAGIATRIGMGGRSAHRTRGYAMVTIAFVVVTGYVGIIGGSWMIERFTGDRAAITRRDLEVGRRDLTLELARANRAGDAAGFTLLETRVARVERLEAASDPQIEDYLWTQQAQINQPLIAYGKLRVMEGPMLKFGPDRDPIEGPKHASLGIVGLELLVGMFIAYRAVRSKR